MPPPSAALTEPRRSDPTAARPPTARPDRRRKARRSMASEAKPAARACSFPFAASPLLRLVSMGQPSLLERLVAIGAVEGLDVIALAIAGLRLLAAGVVGLRVGGGDGGRCGGHCHRRSAAHGAEEVAAIHRRFLVLGHSPSPSDDAFAPAGTVRRLRRRPRVVPPGRARYASMAKASASISKNSPPTRATAR